MRTQTIQVLVSNWGFVLSAPKGSMEREGGEAILLYSRPRVTRATLGSKEAAGWLGKQQTAAKCSWRTYLPKVATWTPLVMRGSVWHVVMRLV